LSSETPASGEMASSDLSDPPDPEEREPLVHGWPKGERIHRCHDVRFGATEFNPGLGGGRFHPLYAAGGGKVPTLYGANTVAGALSETLFHHVPVRGAHRAIRRGTLFTLLLSTLAPRRELRLAQLHGYGLRRLEVSRKELIDSEAVQYPATRGWGEALHRSPLELDGIIWVSRQHDTSFACVLFGDRVDRSDLDVVEPPMPLVWGPGFDQVQRAAEASGIAVLL